MPLNYVANNDKADFHVDTGMKASRQDEMSSYTKIQVMNTTLKKDLTWYELFTNLLFFV